MSAIYKVTLGSEISGEGALNIWHYVSNEIYNPQALAEIFVDLIVPSLTGITHVKEEYRFVTVEDATKVEVTRFTILLTDITGIRVGNAAPAFNAWAYKLIAYTSITRAGRKSFQGVNQEDTAGDVPQEFFENNLANVTDVLSAVLVLSSFSFIPAIFRAPTETELGLINPIVEAQFARLSTQNSRKSYSGGGIILPTFSNAVHDLTDGIIQPTADIQSQSVWIAGGGVPTYWTVTEDGTLTPIVIFP